MVLDINLIATVILGWTAMCHGDIVEHREEPRSVIKEYKAGNLNEKLTIDHVTYANPRSRQQASKPRKAEKMEKMEMFEGNGSPPTTMLTEPSSLKPIGMKRLEPTPESSTNSKNNVGPRRPDPTIPEDLLKEVSLMKIPKYDLPKTITNIKKTPLRTFDKNNEDESYEEDDIMEPEYSKYFNDDYQVPQEYQKFKFNVKPLHSKNPKDDAEKHVKIALKKHKVKTIVDKPIIITKTKLVDYDLKDGKDNSVESKNDAYNIYNRYYNQYKNIQKDKIQSGCYNCYKPPHPYNSPLYYPPPPIPPAPPNPRPYYPLGNPYVHHSRYVSRYPPRSRYLRPVYRPSPVYVRRHPPRHPRHYYRSPYRRPRPPYPPPKPLLPPPVPRHPYWHPPPRPTCPPSKVVKEVHVHHIPPAKLEKVPVPVAILEANHHENYDHDSAFGNDEDDELSSDEHEELKEINAHLEAALRKNKLDLNKNMQDGQRYLIEEDEDTGDEESSTEDDIPDYNKILDQALVKNRKELEKNLRAGPAIVKTAYLPDDGIYNLHKHADKSHLYSFPKNDVAQPSTHDYQINLESLPNFEARKILQDGTPIRYIMTNHMSYNHTKPNG